MDTYLLSSVGSKKDYVNIVKEVEDGYVIQIVRDRDGYKDVTTDFIGRSLFMSCLRTGYLTKVSIEDAHLANA